MIEHIARLYFYPSRVVFILLTFSLPGYTKLLAQRAVVPFAESYEIKAGKNAEGLLSSDINGDGLTDLITFGGKNVNILFQQTGPVKWRTVTVRIDQQIDVAVAGRCNNDRFGDIVVLTEEPRRVQVLLGRSRDKVLLTWRKWIGEPVKHILVNDINNDGNNDLLMYGEKLLGMRVMAGNGNGTFQSSVTLFDEYPFNSITIADMNDDGVNDIIASHWVMNQLLIYSGYGKMRFSDPVTVPLGFEPLFIETSTDPHTTQKSIFVASSEPASLTMLSGDELGNYRQTQSVILKARPSQISFGDIDNDGISDVGILSRDDRSLSTMPLNVPNTDSQLIQFSAGKKPLDFVFFSHDTTVLTDAAVLDADTRNIKVYVNSKVEKLHQQKNPNYLTGLLPTEIIAADVDNDLDNDIFVANSGSASISFFRNLGAAIFDAQVSFSTILQPENMQLLQNKDSHAILFMKNRSANEYSMMNVDTKKNISQSVSLPFRDEVNVESAFIDARTSQTRFFATESDHDARQVSVLEIKDSGYKLLAENVCSPVISGLLSGIAIGDIYDDTSPDILYIQYNSGQKTQDVYRMSETKPRQFSQPALLHSIAVRESSSAMIWHHDMNGDLVNDLIIHFSEPEQSLRFFITRSDTDLSESKTRIREVSVDTKNDLLLTDANGDGIEDVVVRNKLQKSIHLYNGRGDGTFLPRIRLMSTEGIGGFTLSDIDNDDIPELLYTDMINGALRILSFNTATR